MACTAENGMASKLSLNPFWDQGLSCAQSAETILSRVRSRLFRVLKVGGNEKSVPARPPWLCCCNVEAKEVAAVSLISPLFQLFSKAKKKQPIYLNSFIIYIYVGNSPRACWSLYHWPHGRMFSLFINNPSRLTAFLHSCMIVAVNCHTPHTWAPAEADVNMTQLPPGSRSRRGHRTTGSWFTQPSKMFRKSSKSPTLQSWQSNRSQPSARWQDNTDNTRRRQSHVRNLSSCLANEKPSKHIKHDL